MKTLERYIAVTIFKATGLITLIITGVLFLLTLLTELKNIGYGDFGIFPALAFVFLRLPTLVYQFSPLLLLLGSIVGLSMLYTHREIVVMRTAGFSIVQLIKTVLITAVVLVSVLAIIGELIGPPLSSVAEIYKDNEENAGQAVVTSKGVWFHVDNNFIHVQHVVNKQLLEGVTTYQFDDQHHLLASYYANSLAYKHNKWRMYEVAKTTLFNDHTVSTNYDELPWEVRFNPNLFSIGVIDAEEMSLAKLATFANYLKHNNLQAQEYEYNFWQRIFQPFSSLIMIMLSIPFVLGALSSATVGWRILIGLMVGFAFFIIDAFLGELCIVYQLPAFFAAAIAPIVFVVLSVLLMRRLRFN